MQRLGEWGTLLTAAGILRNMAIRLMRRRNSLGTRGERNPVLVSDLHWIALGEKYLGFLA